MIPNFGNVSSGTAVTAAAIAAALALGTGIVISRGNTLSAVDGGASDLTLTDAGAINVTQLTGADGGGAVTVPSGSSLAFSSNSSGLITVGATPATSGLFEFPNGATMIGARNAANSGNLTALGTDSSNNVIVGGNTTVTLANAFKASSNALSLMSVATAYTVSQAAQTSDATTNALTLQAQSAFASASSNKNGADLRLQGGTAASGGSVGRVDFNNATTSTSAPSAGGGGALPITPSGYMTIRVGGVDRQIAYYYRPWRFDRGLAWRLER